MDKSQSPKKGTKTCTEHGCGQPHSAKGLCRHHYGKARYQEKREQVLASVKRYSQTEAGRAVNQEAVRKYNQSGKRRSATKRWAQTEHGNAKRLASHAKRRAAKLNATPPWLSDEQHAWVVELYETQQVLNGFTDVEWHVDHIVPLLSEDVCGLHVPWNLQVIPARDNLRKKNKLIESHVKAF